MYKNKDQLKVQSSYETRIVVKWSIETPPEKSKSNKELQDFRQHVNNDSRYEQ